MSKIVEEVLAANEETSMRFGETAVCFMPTCKRWRRRTGREGRPKNGFLKVPRISIPVFRNDPWRSRTPCPPPCGTSAGLPLRPGGHLSRLHRGIPG